MRQINTLSLGIKITKTRNDREVKKRAAHSISLKGRSEKDIIYHFLKDADVSIFRRQMKKIDSMKRHYRKYYHLKLNVPFQISYQL